MTSKKVTIKLESGLEARPVAMLVQVASQYDSDIYVESASKRIDAKSIMGMMSLALGSGENVVVEMCIRDRLQADHEDTGRGAPLRHRVSQKLTEQGTGTFGA